MQCFASSCLNGVDFGLGTWAEDLESAGADHHDIVDILELALQRLRASEGAASAAAASPRHDRPEPRPSGD